MADAGAALRILGVLRYILTWRIVAARNQMPQKDRFNIVGTVVDDRYRVERVVGEGGFGVVYRAHHLRLDGPVALKVLKVPSDAASHEAMTEAFENEGKLLFSLALLHGSIVRVTESGTLEAPEGVSTPYLVLEWLDGVPLGEELEYRSKRGIAPMSLAEMVELLDGPVAALAVAHGRSIAHRDIKPNNLFLSLQDGQVCTKLLDFGTAKVFEASFSISAMLADTAGGRCLFAPAYGAPEQWERKLGATGPWTDVYALALTCLEVLTQQPALRGQAPELMEACLNRGDRPTPRSRGLEVTDAVERAFARALAVDPRERFPDVAAFWQALRDGLGAVRSKAPTIALLSERAHPATRRSHGAPVEPCPPCADAEETVPVGKRPVWFKAPLRFNVGCRLGAGAFGEVYEVLDTKTNIRVALKTLHRADATALHRFKQEFRALADIVHPNLVQLYELFYAEERWFFTMELVRGCSFLEYLNRIRSSPEAAGSRTSEVYLERLESTLTQLVKGIGALHSAGRLHRDLKPSNVLVTCEGRVVILDFGLVTEARGDKFGQETMETAFMGTPNYMPPEQMAGASVSEASDWYAVGVMLYQALSGELPFRADNIYELLVKKQREQPRPLMELVRDVPEHLAGLCAELLSTDPERRPTGRMILASLRAGAGAPPESARASSDSSADSVFVGRERQLAMLDEAFQASCRGRAVTVFVHGRSGMGKTALVRHFLEGLTGRDPVVVLTGRSYQQEAVPFKAWDGVIDSLARYLRRLSDLEAAALVPRHARDLVRLFPALERVGALADASLKGPAIFDHRETRRRAFAALRSLFVRISDETPLVVFMDDVQWGDRDSAVLLLDLLWGPERPSMLVIGAFRSDEVDTSPMLMELLRSTSSSHEDWRELEVAELPEERAIDLARILLSQAGKDGSRAVGIAHESEGIPFFIAELARFAAEVDRGALDPPPSQLRLNGLVRRRAARLSEDARRLLEVVAVAARPAPVSVCLRAAGHESTELKSLALLRADHLVRVRSTPAGEAVATYHDRIRESVLGSVSPEEKRRVHLRLAEAFEALEPDDAERLSVHFHAAGKRDKAAVYTLRAADEAFESFAFDHAARLYERALELRSEDDAHAHSLLVKLGEAYSHAGRGKEAAAAYMRATAGQPSEAIVQLRHRASFQLLSTGYREEGLRIIREVLRSVGLRLPTYNWWGILCLLLRRTWLRIRGIGFRRRTIDEVDPALLLRAEACYAVAVSMSVVDPMLGWADFQTRQLLLHLSAGEPSGVAKALSSEAMILSTSGDWKRAHEVADRCTALSRTLDEPVALGRAIDQEGFLAFWEGHWRQGFEKFERATRLLSRDRVNVDAYRLAVSRAHALWCLGYMGRMREMSRRLPVLLREAREQRNLNHEFLYGQDRTNCLTFLAADDLAGARTEVQLIYDHLIRGVEQPNQWYLLHCLTSRLSIALYAGDARLAWEEVEQHWPPLARSMVFRIPMIRCQGIWARGQATLALAAAHQGREQEHLLEDAGRSARMLDRSPIVPAPTYAASIRAGIAVQERRFDDARHLLAVAEEGYAEADMFLDAAACLRRQGELVGGDEGQAMIADATARMASEGIVSPARWSDMVAPGNWTA